MHLLQLIRKETRTIGNGNKIVHIFDEYQKGNKKY